MYDKILNKNLDNDEDIAYLKALGSKNGIYKGKHIATKNSQIDPDFYGLNKSNILKKAYIAKFNQNPNLREILLNTRDAKLIRLRKGYPPEVLDELMIIRNDLK